MPPKPSFNFGANRKKSGRKKSSKASKGKSQAWRKYISNAPIPD